MPDIDTEDLLERIKNLRREVGAASSALPSESRMKPEDVAARMAAADKVLCETDVTNAVDDAIHYLEQLAWIEGLIPVTDLPALFGFGLSRYVLGAMTLAHPYGVCVLDGYVVSTLRLGVHGSAFLPGESKPDFTEVFEHILKLLTDKGPLNQREITRDTPVRQRRLVSGAIERLLLQGQINTTDDRKFVAVA